jgi:hypothetical protein
MLRIQPASILVACLLVLTVAAGLPVSAQVLSPFSRTAAGSAGNVTLQGYAVAPRQKVKIEAVDQNTGKLITLDTVAAAKSGTAYRAPSGTKYILYPWTYKAGVLAANYWSPQSIVADLSTSQGHLELRASVGTNTILETFSKPAFTSLKVSLMFSHDFLKVAGINADGHATVLFDQDGVKSGPPTPWVNVQGMVSNPPTAGYSSVAWSVGSYTVEGGKTIYALICSPTSGGPYPLVIYNHGGILALGNLHGAVTATGWTSPPGGSSDDLAQCTDWAKRGWVFAESSYRNESVNITSADPAFPSPATPWTSGGNPEFCLGEVTDVMALNDLLVNQTSSITVGNTANPVHLNLNGKVFMYGWSHGGCITYRAVEQGAPVTAFAVVEGFTDTRLTYMNNLSTGQSAMDAATGSGAYQWLVSYYLPDAVRVMGYNWRSARYFASRGDLNIKRFKTMPILIFHGDVNVDPANPANINPVFLNEPVVFAADIGATNIFVGPAVAAPTSVPCIAGAAGAPIVDTTTQQPLAPLASCPVSFMVMDATDPCVSGSTVPAQLSECSALSLPLPPSAGQPQQLRYLVVYHNMDHFNGGLAIKDTFDGFVEQNFGRKPGCDGVAVVCNAN